MQIKLLPVFLITLLLIAGCGNGSQEEEEEVYQVRGRYMSTQIGGESISVIHEEIPDVMHAMRMDFRIDDPSISEQLETGDVIEFEMVITEGNDRYARNIEKLPPDTELDLPEVLQDVGVR